MLNGALCVDGLTPGQSWSVYSLAGVLIYRGAAPSTGRAEIALPARSSTKLTNRGIYIVTHGTQAVKIAY
jgi:hypothetical protein